MTNFTLTFSSKKIIIQILFLGAMGVIDAVMGSDEQHRSVIEKTWREGHEYFRVEPQLICHDGESIQVGEVRRLLDEA